MIKLVIGLFSVFAVATAGYGYGGGDKYELASLEAPLLPKGGVVSYAQSQVQPLYQSPPVYSQPPPPPPPPPQQQAPLQPYYPQVPQQQPAQSYVPQQQQPPAAPTYPQPAPQTYPQPPPQQSPPVYTQPSPPSPPQQQPPALEPYYPQQQQQPPAPQPPQYPQPPPQQPPRPVEQQQPSYVPAAQPPAAQSYVPQEQQPPAQTYVPAAQPPQYAPQPPPQQPPRPVEDFCQKNNLVEGYHGKGCKPYYFACNAFTTTRIACPKGLFYDTQTQQCDYKTVIVACGGRPAPPPQQQPPVYAPAPQPSYGQPAQQPPAPVIPEYDCTNKADGIYVVGCASKYYICMLGTATTLSCPAGTFYSAKTERCDYKAHVVECGGVPPPAQNPPSQVPYGQASQPPQASYQPQQQQPPQSSYQPQQQQPSQPSSNNNQCANLENGIYGRKCSRHFVACSNYRTFDFMCPNGYAFNVKTVKCAPKNTIPTCPEYEIPQQQPAQSYVPAAQPPQAQPPAPQSYDSQPLVPDYKQESPAVPAYASRQPSYQQQPVQQQYPQRGSYY